MCFSIFTYLIWLVQITLAYFKTLSKMSMTILLILFCFSSPNLLYMGFFLSFGLLIALHIKKNETPTNFYLLIAFVSYLLISSKGIPNLLLREFPFYQTWFPFKQFEYSAHINKFLLIDSFSSYMDFKTLHERRILTEFMLSKNVVVFFIASLKDFTVF